MNGTFVYVVRYADGRLFPAQKPLPPEVTERLRGLEHRLRCTEGLSFRQVQKAMMVRFGARRSLGQLHLDLTRYECPRCASAPAETPRPAPVPPPATASAQPPANPRVRAEVFEWR